MILVSTALIGYEIITSTKNNEFILISPNWYIVCDIIVTLALLFGIFIKIYDCKWIMNWGILNIMDIVVFLLLVILCLTYIAYPYQNNIDSLSLLVIRLFRDSIRIVRFIWLFRVLCLNYIDLQRLNNHDGLDQSLVHPI